MSESTIRTWSVVLSVVAVVALSACGGSSKNRSVMDDDMTTDDMTTDDMTDDDGSQLNRLVKKIDIFYSSSAPLYADDSDTTIAENPGYGFSPIVAQTVYDGRGAERRSSEGELKSLDRTRIAAIATSAEQVHEGYIITYDVDDTKRSYFFDDIAVNESTSAGGGVRGYRYWDDDPERTYHDLGWWAIDLDDGDYIVREDAVFGFETRPVELQVLGSATYEGWWHTRFVKGGEFTHPDQTNLYGSMTLNADLSEGEISGLVTDLLLWPSPQEDPDRTGRYLAATNRIVISNGLISDSRFDSEWEVQDENSAEAIDDSIRGFSGEMLGAFYGPNGEEIAGVVTGSRSVIGTTEEIFARGSFSGVKSVDTD